MRNLFIMGKRKKKQPELPDRKSRRSLILPVIAVVAVLVIAGGLLLSKKDTTPRVQKQDVSRAGTAASKASTPSASDRFQRLVGRWRRPDGGYIIDIRNVDARGNLLAGYFNPRSIHVSQARAALKEGKIQVFIELTDTGYPGATYSLTYEPKRDVLAGLYFQPTAGRNFEVIFARLPPQ